MNKYILPTILIAASISLFIFYIDPTYKEVKDLKEVESQYSVALTKSFELREVRDGLLQRYNSFSESDLERIEKMVPNNVDNVRLVMDIDSMAAEYGSTLRDVVMSVSSEEEGTTRLNIAEAKDYDFVNLQFSILATYENFVSFVTDLKDSLRLVDIVSLSFKPTAQNPSVYKFNFTIKTYYLK